jgi:hypothetical protein
MSDKKEYDYEALKAFYKRVCVLTAHHDVVGDYAVVFPNKLSDALEKVDKNWWSNYNK